MKDLKRKTPTLPEDVNEHAAVLDEQDLQGMVSLGLVYRALGNRSQAERLGVGFMRKKPLSRDGTSDHYSLIYVLQGEGTYTDVNGTKDLSAGAIFQRIPNWDHCSIAGEGYLECFLALPESIYRALRELGVLSETSSVINIGVSGALVTRVKELCFELKDAPERQLPAIMGKTITLIADILAGGHSDRDSKMVEEACQVLGSRLNTRMSIPKMCEAHGWGYERFRKVFQQHIGMSPGQYRIRRRIDSACELLHNRELTIAEISERLGYPSPFEFSGQFKKQTGKSPSHYRR